MSQAEKEAEKVARAVIRRLFQDNYAPRKSPAPSKEKVSTESPKNASNHAKEEN